MSGLAATRRSAEMASRRLPITLSAPPARCRQNAYTRQGGTPEQPRPRTGRVGGARRGAGRGRAASVRPGRCDRPDRHGLLDRSDHDRARRLLPAGCDDRGGSAALLRRPVPDRRSRRHLLRPAEPPHGRGVAGAHAARLRVRHQGPRPDDRPAIGGEAAAEGDPRGDPAGAGRQEADLRQGPAGRAVRRDLGHLPGRASSRSTRPASWVRCSCSTRAGSIRRTSRAT